VLYVRQEMKIEFHESPECYEWLCDIPLADFDPFEKGNLTISIDNIDGAAPHIGDFVDDFLQRYPKIWPTVQSLLATWGWSWDELNAAHQATRIDIIDGSENPPPSWDLTYDFLFSNGYILGLSLSFERWEPDDKLVGCH
jgi:hypothetical protein